MDRLERLLTPAELATYLGVPIATLYVWRHRRLGPPSFKAGRHLRYRLHDVEQWINNRVEKVHDDSIGWGE
ncbi:MAG: helix-turn-helix domain-containing protein [Actinomycetota bacterium]|nr:helix-turn-helix domain-containing protein [Actinomycetota bacterium]